MLFDPRELNYSKIRTYRECPQLYRLIYVEQKRQPFTPLSSLGVSIHRALDAFHKRGAGLEELQDAYDQGWLAAGYSGAQEQMEHYNKGRQLLENYWAAEMAREFQVKWTEKVFEFPAEDFRIKGTIDRVDRLPDGTCELIDYKTGPEPIEQEDLPGLQLTIYGAGVQRGLGERPSVLSYWHLCSGRKLSAPYDQAAADKAISLFLEIGRKILAGEFAPNRDNCRRCLLKNECNLCETE